MKTHELDPVALVFGLLFTLTGAAVMTDRAIEGLDVTAVTSVAVAIVGVFLVVMIVIRLIRDQTSSSPDALSPADSSEPPEPHS